MPLGVQNLDETQIFYKKIFSGAYILGELKIFTRYKAIGLEWEICVCLLLLLI